MGTARPGLIVLGVILVAGLVYLWTLSNFAQPDPIGPADQRKNAAATTDENAGGNARTGEAGRKADKFDTEDREVITTGPRYALRGEVLSRKETPLTGAAVIAYVGSPNDRRINILGVMSAADPDSPIAPELLQEELGDPIGRATVNEDGTFEFKRLRSQHVRLAVDHDFYALGQPRTTHLDPSGDSFIILRPYLGGHIAGRVQGYVPATGETVKLIAEIDPMYFMRNPQHFIGQVMSSIGRTAGIVGDDGRFEFRAVLPSSSLSLTYRGATRAAVRGDLAIEAGQKREVVLQTFGCGVVAVRITALGEPVEKAMVRLTGVESRGQAAVYSALQGHSNADGVCHVERVLPGSYHVDIDCEGYIGVRRDAFVQPDNTAELDVELDRGGSVRGKVVDPEGNPVADAGVRHIPSMNVPILGDLTEAAGEDLLVRGARQARQRTDQDGKFELSGIDGTAEFVIAAWHEDFSGGFARGVQVGDENIVIELKRATRLIGSVVDDATGAPIPDFTVATLVRMMMLIERPSRSLGITASADGAFELKRVPPGKVVLRVQAVGFADFRKSVTLPAGGEADVGECRLLRGATVRGVVRTSTEQPAAGVIVGRKAVGMLDNPMLQSMFGTISATTDKQGKFELTDLPPGRIILKASSPIHASGVSKRLRLKAGEVLDGVEILLAAGGAIEGKLTLTEGLVLKGWMVTVSSQQGGSMRTDMIADDGTFRFDGIDPGRYDVQAMHVDWMRNMQSQKMGMFRPGKNVDIGKMIESAQQELVRTRCRVKDGETTNVLLDGSDLGEDGVALTIHVTLGMQPMKAGWLEVERIGDGLLTQCGINAGVAKLASVQPGQYRLTVRTGITMTPVGDPKTVTVPLGKTHVAALSLAGGSIEGRVVNEATNAALEHAVVRVVSAKGVQTDQMDEIGFAITNGAGEFRFEGLDDGEYSLFANDSFFNSSDKKHGGRLDDVRISGGAAVERVVLRARQAARATVRVSDPSGLGVGRTMLLAVDPTGKPMSTLPTFTDGEGRATLNGLPPGRMRVVAMASNLVPGYSDVEEILEARETNILVTMGRGPRVKVRIEDQSGKTVIGAKLSARWRDGPWIPISLVQRFDPKTGYLDLGHLPPVAVEFRVHSPASKPFLVQRTLPSGSSAELVFTMPK